MECAIRSVLHIGYGHSLISADTAVRAQDQRVPVPQRCPSLDGVLRSLKSDLK